MNINEYKTCKFRELKAKKKAFGFELSVYDPASIIAAAKAINGWTRMFWSNSRPITARVN